MNVAIVHYHLKPGGVTRVIENAVASLRDHHVNCVVISGEPYLGDALPRTETIEALGYTLNGEKPDPHKLAEQLVAQAKASLGGDIDLWHIHNHSLGKNSAMADVVNILAQAGESILLQIHDFAEDGRPANFRLVQSGLSQGNQLYPISPKIHYALLNGRDHGFMVDSSDCYTENIHLLPNPVAVPQLPDEAVQIDALNCERLILYPTRAIRRKNMGEFLLASMTARSGELFASTLAPANPTARPLYERWAAFARDHQLAARLGVAEELSNSFAEIMQAADAIITTSVAEGFGLAFLEPWLFGKPLMGRDIPDITQDFKAAGMRLDGLYDRLMVPAGMVDTALLKEKLSAALSEAYASYERELPEGALSEALTAMMDAEEIDFGRLDEPLQESVLLQVKKSPNVQQAIAEQIGSIESQKSHLSDNRAAIETDYTLEKSGKRIRDIYDKILAAEKNERTSIGSAKILDCFLEPRRFSLLRT